VFKISDPQNECNENGRKAHTKAGGGAGLDIAVVGKIIKG
jgi:hypothetical protein